MHGFLLSHPDYAVFSRHLASWGFVAVGIDFGDDGDQMRDAQEAIATIDWALGPGTPLSGAVDPARIATAGHSLGGKVAFFAAVLDPRIKAVVGWDPVDSGGPPCFVDPNGCHKWSIAPNSYNGDVGMMDGLHVAALVFGAPPGAFNPEEHNAKRFWEGTKAPGLFVVFPKGDHLRWPNGDPEQRITKRTQLAWLLHHLNGVGGVDDYLTGAVMQQDIVAGRVAVVAK
jgi:pimeloyl-ACP methyl ester carboxylesterase